MESDRLARALALAVGCHRKQRRKGSRLPYLTHPLAVAAAIASCSDDENLLLAAILHDAAECGGGEAVLDLIGEQLGPAVARLVRSASILGQNTDWLESKRQRLAALDREGTSGRLLGACDVLDNALSIHRDLLRVGSRLWGRFAAGRDQVLAYLAEAAATLAPSAEGPRAELAAVVRSIQAVAAGRPPLANLKRLGQWRRRPSPIKERLSRELAAAGEREAQIALACLEISGLFGSAHEAQGHARLEQAGASELARELPLP